VRQRSDPSILRRSSHFLRVEKKATNGYEGGLRHLNPHKEQKGERSTEESEQKNASLCTFVIRRNTGNGVNLGGEGRSPNESDIIGLSSVGNEVNYYEKHAPAPMGVVKKERKERKPTSGRGSCSPSGR